MQQGVQMTKHLIFLRWWVIASLIFISSYFLYQFGICEEIWKTDSTLISAGIVGVFSLMTVWCGIKTFTLSHGLRKSRKDLIETVKNQEQIGWFTADLFTMAGFVGTIWGMIVALKGFDGVNPSDIMSIQHLISALVHGVSIALYTTLTGLVCSALLKIQYFNLGYALEGRDNEEK